MYYDVSAEIELDQADVDSFEQSVRERSPCPVSFTYYSSTPTVWASVEKNSLAEAVVFVLSLTEGFHTTAIEASETTKQSFDHTCACYRGEV